MGRHGENIRRRQNDGRWEGRYKVYHEEKGKYIYRSVYGHTYDEVKTKLLSEKQSIHTIQSGSRKDIINKNSLFSQTASEWLGDIREKCKYSTYVKYHTIYETHLANILGDCTLTEITDLKLRTEIPDHLSETLLRSIYFITNQILRYANSNYYMNIPLLTRINAKTDRKSVETLSLAEQEKLFDCLFTNMDRYKAAVSFSLYLGLRLGEICALKWSDIDFENNTVAVNHTVQRIAASAEHKKTNLLETCPKSDSSKRIIPISCDILHMLDKIQNNQTYIFGGNKALEPRTMQYQFKRILKEAQIADRNFHILRHTFATNCIENGIDVKSLSEILGHSDVRITLNRYVHPTMDAKRLQLEHLRCFYGQIHGQAF
ncbi:MAG: site-specific integrase [Lachnospiraceae bacterium]|jgi:integrase|nr:site-specific integrase [Lachnospiraceae bacterium]